MPRDTFLKVSQEASAERAFDHVVAISQFHRIQASPGFRAAAEYCADRMLETQPEASLIRYPADSETRFWSLPSFEEWHGKKGVLEVLSPGNLAGKIADFEACPISMIQRSRATPPGGLVTRLVYAGVGKNAKDYRKAKGKIVICDAYCPREVYDAAVGAGAIGIILYRHRPLPPLRKGAGVEGVRQYNSFWWNEKELFGFVLTPEDGQNLIAYLTSVEARRRPVRARALVESETYPGSLEVVTSLIPGRQKREIVVVAHLCHPKPSAGDNASGVAALLEAHRVLGNLIDKGKLRKPEFGIRFLLVPEITGTFAYLSREQAVRRRLLFGLNLDMVGQKQEVTGSTLCIESPPLAASSFTPYLLEEVVRRAFMQSTNPGSTSQLASVRLQPTSFSGGSDHFILSDPTVGVPTPMLLQWPDKYYHTSGDTPDKVSADVLRRIVIGACVYAYTIAQASEKEILWLAGLTGRGLRKRVIDEMGRTAPFHDPSMGERRDRARLLLTSGRQALRSLRKLMPGSEDLKTRLAREEKALSRCVRQELSLTPADGRRAKRETRSRQRGRAKYAGLVVKRLLPGPVDMGAVLMQLGKRRISQYRRWTTKERQAYMMQILALYWADGKKDIAQIARLVGAELGHTNPDFLKFYFDLLGEVGIVRISRR
jgi:aminopeptidase YwaD